MSSIKKGIMKLFFKKEIHEIKRETIDEVRALYEEKVKDKNNKIKEKDDFINSLIKESQSLKFKNSIKSTEIVKDNIKNKDKKEVMDKENNKNIDNEKEIRPKYPPNLID